MFARELPDGTFVMIEQENHTDLSAQFAAHWGNDQFSRPEPYSSVLFGTIYHDSGHREMEADLPIDVERGVPYAIGRTPPGVRKNEADVVNAHWVKSRDPYASLLVSVHHTGLRKERYDSVRKRIPEPAVAATKGLDSVFEDLQPWQREIVEQLGLEEPAKKQQFWHNYRLLQVYDLLSLYFCRDGFKKGEMQEVVLENVPVSSDSDKTVDMTISPTGPSSLRMNPYPLDLPSLSVSMMTRVIKPVPDAPEAVAKEQYYKAQRVPIVCEVTR